MLALLSLVKTLDFRWWIIIVLFAALAAMSTVSWLKSVRIDSLKNEIDKQEVEITIFKNSIEGLKLSINKQNQAIEALVKYTEDVEVTLAATTEQNRKLNLTAQQLIKHINTSYVPPDCAGSVDHLNKFANEFAQEWNK